MSQANRTTELGIPYSPISKVSSPEESVEELVIKNVESNAKQRGMTVDDYLNVDPSSPKRCSKHVIYKRISAAVREFAKDKQDPDRIIYLFRHLAPEVAEHYQEEGKKISLSDILERFRTHSNENVQTLAFNILKNSLAPAKISPVHISPIHPYGKPVISFVSCAELIKNAETKQRSTENPLAYKDTGACRDAFGKDFDGENFVREKFKAHQLARA